MQREYKYRAKRLDGKGWVYGMPVQSVNDRCYMIVGATEDAVNTRNEIDFMYVEVDPGTLGEYTGMKDMNGLEVYEDDIVLQQQYGGGKGKMVVRFEKGAFIVGYHQWNMVKTKPMLLNVRCEVIGNIHDNPELLKME